LAVLNFHRIETMDSYGSSHFLLKTYPSAGVSERSSSVRIGKHNAGANASLGSGDEDATGCMAGLNITAVMYCIRPQTSFRAVPKPVL
jgi:hypothetical protein